MAKDKFRKLREKAEKELKNYNLDKSFSEEDKEQLIHELQVQKIELEMQNEELKDAKEQLEQSRDHFSLLYNNSPEGIVTLDKNGIILESNNTFSNMLNLPQEKIVNKNFTTFIHPNRLPVFMARYKAFFKSPPGKSIEIELVGNDSKNVYALLSAVKISNPALHESEGLLMNITDISERKQVEIKLAENIRLLSHAQEMAHLGNWNLDLDTNELYWSDEVYRIFGCKPQDFPATYEAFLSFIHPDDRDLVNNAYLESLQESHDGYDIEHRIIRRDTGDVRHVHERCTHRRDATGSIIQSVGMVQDITERKQAEEKIKDSEKTLRDIFEGILAGFWDWNLVENTEYLSPTFKKMFGYEDHELENSPETWQKLIFEEDLPGVLDVFNKHIESHGKIPFYNEVRYHHKDGSAVWVMCAGKVIEWTEEGDPIRMVGCHINITKRKRIEIALQESEERFRTVYSESPMPILIHDKDTGDILDANKSAYETYSLYSLDNLMAHKFWADEAPYSYEDALRYIHKAASGEQTQFEWKGYDVEGNAFWEYVTLRLITLDGTERVLSTAIDITDRKQAEENIQKQLAEKEILLKEVHHRIKNNIASIEGLLSLQAGSATNTEVKEALQDAMSQVQSMRILYDKLLLNKEYDEVSVQNYAESLIDSIKGIFAKDGTTVEKHISDFKISSKDAITIGIIINELLTNVFKYAFHNRTQGSVSISIDKKEDVIKLVIQDNGVGIDERILENESPGFGLTIVKMLVDQLDGSINITNENGAKSVIQFESLL